MKRLFIVIVMTLLIGKISVYAINSGVVLNLNASRFYSNGHYSEYKYGTGIGIFYDLQLTSRLFLTNEIIISNIGANYTSYLYDIPYKTTFNLNYLNVPLLLHWQMLKKSSYNLFLIGGPVIGFNLKKSVQTKIASLTINERIKMFDPANLILALGMGINTQHMRIYFKYNIGILSIISTRFGEAKPSYLSISIGLPFQ